MPPKQNCSKAQSESKASEVGEFRMYQSPIRTNASEAELFQGSIRTESLCSRSVIINVQNRKPLK
jgi:hypothetical protein